MKRHRWFRAEWPIAIRLLAQRLKSKPFDDHNANGFVIDRVRDDFLEARYIERMEYTDTVTDPFGKELSFQRVEFKQCEFRASSDLPGLELLDAPRSTQGLVSGLVEASDFLLTVSPLVIDVLTWASLFQSLTNIHVVVDSLQIGALELERGIIAKTVISGDKDVREASSLITKDRRYNLEKVQLRLYGHHHGTILLTNVGAAKINVQDREDLVIALRQCLATMLVNSNARIV